MAFPWGAAISAVGSIAGGFLGRSGAARQNQQNIQLSRDQMAFQERMRNTAYQAAMKDMRLAGLNPILAYQQGGASSPGGAAIPVVNEMTDMANSARSATGKFLEAKMLNAQIDKAKAELHNVNADTDLKYELGAKAIEDTRAANALSVNLLKDGLIKDETLASAKAAAARDKSREEILKTKWGKAATKIGTLGREANPFLESSNSAKRLGKK